MSKEFEDILSSLNLYDIEYDFFFGGMLDFEDLDEESESGGRFVVGRVNKIGMSLSDENESKNLFPTVNFAVSIFSVYLLWVQ